MASGILQQSSRAAIYARVSTTNHGQDVSMQTRDLEQFARARGWRLVDSYLDLGISGSKDKRPQLDRLMADAHKRRFDIVIVWRFDRFARSVSHLLRALETFNALGIAFVSLSEQSRVAMTAVIVVFKHMSSPSGESLPMSVPAHSSATRSSATVTLLPKSR